MGTNKRSFSVASFLAAKNSPDAPYHRTLQFAMLPAIHTELRTQEHHTAHDVDRLDQYRSLRNTTVDARNGVPFPRPRKRIEDFRCAIAQGKILFGPSNDARARMRPAKFGEKIGFCQLLESQFDSFVLKAHLPPLTYR